MCNRVKMPVFDFSIMCERINELIKGDSDAGEYSYRAILFYGRPNAKVTVTKYPDAYSELLGGGKIVFDLFYAYTRPSIMSNLGELKETFRKIGFDYLVVPNTDIANHGIMTLLSHPRIRAPFGTFENYIIPN